LIVQYDDCSVQSLRRAWNNGVARRNKRSDRLLGSISHPRSSARQHRLLEPTLLDSVVQTIGTTICLVLPLVSGLHST